MDNTVTIIKILLITWKENTEKSTFLKWGHDDLYPFPLIVTMFSFYYFYNKKYKL